MLQGVILSIAVIAMVPEQTDSANVKDCESDIECHEGYYCYMETQTCSKCTECKSYFRNDNSLDVCAKGPSMCGSCLPGYNEEVLIGSKYREMCVAIEGVEGGVFTNYIILIAAVVPLVAVIVSLAFYIRRGRSNRAPSRDEETGCLADPPPEPLPRRPPPYEAGSQFLISPSAPPLSTSGCEVDPLILGSTGVESEVLQKAVPFIYRPEDDLNGFRVEPPLNETTDEESVVEGPEGPDLSDDTTTPSTWTPYRSEQQLVNGEEIEEAGSSGSDGEPPEAKRSRRSSGDYSPPSSRSSPLHTLITVNVINSFRNSLHNSFDNNNFHLDP